MQISSFAAMTEEAEPVSETGSGRGRILKTLQCIPWWQHAGLEPPGYGHPARFLVGCQAQRYPSVQMCASSNGSPS